MIEPKNSNTQLIGDKTMDLYDAIETPSQRDSHAKPSLTDGYKSWSDSSLALDHAKKHVIFYIAIGVVGYSFLLETQWSIIDSIYFSIVILTTVGYGDLSPDSSTAGMLFTIFFALYGIGIVGIFLGILGNQAVERQENLAKERLKETRKSWILSISPDSGSLLPVGGEQSENTEASFFTDVIEILRDAVKTLCVQIPSILSLTILAIPVFVLEKWDAVKGMYWVVITGTTIGLGDETPSNEWTKVFCIFYIPLVVIFAGSMLGKIATYYVEKRNDAVEQRFLERAMTAKDIQNMDMDGNNKVSKFEFLVYMLTALQKVESEDIEEITNLFETLDKDKSDYITAEDIYFISDRTAKLHRQSKRKL